MEYYPNLVQELKRRDASINGTLNQSSARLEGDKLIVTLSHGGGNLLLSRHADRLLSDIIREEFGVSVQVEFDGTLTLDSDSVAYIEKQKKQEETLRREAVVQESRNTNRAWKKALRQRSKRSASASARRKPCCQPSCWTPQRSFMAAPRKRSRFQSAVSRRTSAA